MYTSSIIIIEQVIGNIKCIRSTVKATGSLYLRKYNIKFYEQKLINLKGLGYYVHVVMYMGAVNVYMQNK